MVVIEPGATSMFKFSNRAFSLPGYLNIAPDSKRFPMNRQNIRCSQARRNNVFEHKI